MKIETIENEKKTEWTLPCIIVHDSSKAIALVVSVSNDGLYYGFAINGTVVCDIGDTYDNISPHNGWTLYDGKVILSNN